MKLYNYFKFTLKVNEQLSANLINNIDVIFYNIAMVSDEYNNPIVIKDRKIITFGDKNNANIVYLYIQNDGNEIKDRIDYLLDEEWVIDSLNISIKLKNSSINLSYTIENYEQVYEFEYFENNDFITDFLSKKYVDRTICILGPKPNFLFGYNMKDEKYIKLKEIIKVELQKQILRGKDIVLTNGYIGGETIGYEVANNLKKQENASILNVLAIPFFNLSDKWIPETKNNFENMKKESDAFIEIDKVNNYKYGTPEIYAREKMTKKNDFDIDFASTFIVITDNNNTLGSMKKYIQFQNKELIDIDVRFLQN